MAGLAPWQAPRLYKGERVFILGGGISLRGFNAERLREHHVFAINNSYLLTPWADLLYFADRRWFQWHMDKLAGFDGLKVTRAEELPYHTLDIKLIKWNPKLSISNDPSTVSGFCSGGNAINLAALMGAAEIVLLGFDQKPVGHWHEGHEVKTADEVYKERYLPSINNMAPGLAAMGISVINACPDSALECFPKAALDAVLA